MAVLFDDDVYKEIAPSVAAWIKECRPLSAPGDSSTVAARGLARDMGELKGIQTLLIAAHEHFPDTSVDTVRCLQLAEAIAIVLRQENEAEGRAHAVLKLPRGGLD
jgi:hypothetical protein